jgi:hypothetical protein
MAWISENYALVISVLFGLSEVLALIPGIQANSIFQLVVSVVKVLAGKKDEPKLP